MLTVDPRGVSARAAGEIGRFGCIGRSMGEWYFMKVRLADALWVRFFARGQGGG